ncbi:MAG: hypothetical protein ACOYJL_00775 [Tractidigestivibacter sp.]|uniref:hypothetical protein n=1 Tax=Tractidigestivibacter sp. TaxID=2847320 RepID=UPI003D926FF7
MEEKKHFSWKSFFVAVLTFVCAMLVIVLFGVLFGMVGLPLWPFVMLLLIYASYDGFDDERFRWSAIGAAIGLLTGMSQSVVSELSGSSVAGLVVFFLLAAVTAGSFVMGGVKWANFPMVLMLTITTVFQLTPAQLAGSASADVSAVQALGPVAVGYVVAVVLMWLFGKLVHKVGPKMGK